MPCGLCFQVCVWVFAMFDLNGNFLQALCIFESANAFDLKKHNHRVDMNFVKLLPFWQTFLLFLRSCPDCSLVKKKFQTYAEAK